MSGDVLARHFDAMRARGLKPGTVDQRRHVLRRLAVGRMVDVPGMDPDAVLFSAATSPAYGDSPWERMVLICGWVARGECTAEEVAIALDTARFQFIDDPDDQEVAQAVVVLAAVVRATYKDGE